MDVPPRLASSPTVQRTSASLWSAFVPLLPLMLAVVAGYFATGMVLPVLPRHLHDALGQGTVVIGVMMGSQYASSLFARKWAGEMSDARGPRVAALTGLLTICGVGAAYLASLPFTSSAPEVALALLLAARLLTGLAESFLITATMSWGLSRVGSAHAGKVFGWMGVALFAGLAAGAPIGSALHAHFGFAGLAWAVLVTGLLGAAGTSFIATVPPDKHAPLPFRHVLDALKLPGLGLALCCLGYAMINAFAVLLFVQRGWGGGALALSSVGAGFIVARLLFGHLPDQVGGARVAVYWVMAEALGLGLIWAAPDPSLAWAGAALTGAGYAISFQGFGVEAVKRAPAQSRGAAMGAYAIFQDAAMGLAPPLGGGLAVVAGLDAVFLAAALGALGALGVAAVILRQEAR